MEFEGTNHHILYLYIDSENMLLFHNYISQIEEHNDNVLNGSHPNSGFDLFFPEQVEFNSIKTKMVDFRVKGEMKYFDTVERIFKPCGFYLYPRSSLSKTPLMLANHVGIIDSGYRGFLIGAFRNLANESFSVEKDQRLLQICTPDLKPFLVKMIDEKTMSITDRGSGGFGSTG
jgi:dUTP pyrophosphatase